MVLEIPTVTYQNISSYSQTAVYNTLKNNISAATISRIRGRATIEVHKQKDFPLVEVNMPKILEVRRPKLDYNKKIVKLQFTITIHSINDAESITFTDLVNYTLDQHRDDLHTAHLYKYNVTDITHSFKWDTKIEKKFFKSDITFTVLWRGS